MVAGTQQAVLMVESEADELSEEIMLGAVVFGHEQMQPVINMINELADEAGKPLWDWTPPHKDQALVDKVAAIAEAGLQEAYRIRQKQSRSEKLVGAAGAGAQAAGRAGGRAGRTRTWCARSSAISKPRSSAARS